MIIVEKKKLLLMMTDLDGTIFPSSSKKIIDLVDTLKEIEQRTGASVKFCPISGRTSSYVLSIMDRMETDFKEVGMKNAIGYGAAELGSIIIYGKNMPYKRKLLFSDEKSKIIKAMKKEVNEGKFSKFFETDPDAYFVTAFVLKRKFIKEIETETKKENIGKNLSEDEFNEIVEKKCKTHYYKPLRKELEKKYGKDIDIVFSGVIEAKPREISKDNAIKWMLNKFMTSKEYTGTEIGGIIYCGDSENDKKAVDYISRLALIHGIKAQVFTPSNAATEIRSENIEQWKDKFKKFGVDNCVKISKYPIVEGITDLLKMQLEKGELISKGPLSKEIKDDIKINYTRSL
jgi:HAD superfamily hydrolase (TIGR01484 family)